MTMLNRLKLSAALLAIGSPAFAQNVPTRTLSKADAELSEPFTLIAGVRELRDGRVIAIDPRDKTIQVVDLKAGTTTKLGREGSGPGEYSMPMRVLPMAGDTTGIVDMLNNRVLLINPDAKVGGFVDLNVPPPSGGRGGGGMVMVGGNMPNYADSKGRMYMQGMPFMMTPEGPKSADSVPMIRWNRSSGKRDTLAWLAQPAGATQVSGRGGRGNQSMSIRVGSGPPFAGADAMVVAADGRIAIVHSDPYSVEYVSETGQRTKGAPIKYDKVKVSEGHKKEWRDNQKNSMVMSMTNDNGRRSATMGPPRDVQDPESWGGEYMPPFLQATGTLSFSNDGYLWIRRTGAPGIPPTYDVIDRAGNLVERVVLPKKARLLGFGNNAVYVARVDEDDLQYLQKYRFAMAERP